MALGGSGQATPLLSLVEKAYTQGMFTTTRPAQKRGSRFRPPNPPCTAHAQSQHMIGFAGGLNHYGYVGGNPLRYVDPSGLGPINQWVQDNLGLIERAALRAGIPPDVLCTTIATEMRSASGYSIKRFQEVKAPASFLSRAALYPAFGAGISSNSAEDWIEMAAERTSAGPGQVKPGSVVSDGFMGEFNTMRGSDEHAVFRAAEYLATLQQRNMTVRGIGPFTDRDWVRVISGYNTGDVTSNRGGYGPDYSFGPYSRDIQSRLESCRKLLGKCK